MANHSNTAANAAFYGGVAKVAQTPDQMVDGMTEDQFTALVQLLIQDRKSPNKTLAMTSSVIDRLYNMWIDAESARQAMEDC